jgi:hypothetical protein
MYMRQKTIELIKELEKDYYVQKSNNYFCIDNLYFYDHQTDDDKLIVEWSKKTAIDDSIDYEEIILNDYSEVEYIIGTARDY